MQDRSGYLRLRLNLAKGCSVDQLIVRGKQLEDVAKGVCSGVKVNGRWYNTLQLAQPPRALIRGNQVQVRGIDFGGGGVNVSEQWTFTVTENSIRWKIARTYLSSGVLDDTAMPMMTFQNMLTWNGALLGTGGVAWGKLFDVPNATYGVHTDSALFWNSGKTACLQFKGKVAAGNHQAIRFTREQEGGFSMDSEVTHKSLIPKNGKARFRRDHQDVWAGFPVSTSESVRASYELKSPDFAETFGRGDFKKLDTGAVTELLNTIGRIGVIDENIVGSNGWYSGYACLHEPWLALVGVAIDDANYVRNYAKALDYARDHAIERDGMVKSRWDYEASDSKPGTYNRYGFYEAQWGRLMDTQTSYVTNVADEFDLIGDLKWVRGQKKACESALEYLLRRDLNHNHLVEMETGSHTQKRSSDWMDIVWASYENALVNAELYRALLSWSKIEHILQDEKRASYYSDFAAALKKSFNKPIRQGGFWDADKGWYAYWRDMDGSVHGDNLTLPVNLTALAEGLCDQPQRRKALLATIENRMKSEGLLSWPACVYSFAPGEGANARFPEYENGDIFLAWAEYGVRAYAADDPRVALKYVRQIVEQYKKDGLAFQRYLRSNGQGAGNDILANNCNAILGLYRDIYGIQPKYNRLYLAPHLTPDLNGTRVNYDLRGKPLILHLAVNHYRIECRNISLTSSQDFGVEFGTNKVTYFPGGDRGPVLSVQTATGNALAVEIHDWTGQKRWSISGGKKNAWITQKFFGLKPGCKYRLIGAGSRFQIVSSANASTRLHIRAGKQLHLTLSELNATLQPAPTTPFGRTSAYIGHIPWRLRRGRHPLGGERGSKPLSSTKGRPAPLGHRPALQPIFGKDRLIQRQRGYGAGCVTVF